MALVTGKELLQEAERLSIGMGAFDTGGGQIDILEAILEAAEELKAPVFISDGFEAMENYWRMEYFASVVRMRAKKTKVPIVLHLDHAFRFEYVVKAIRYGFTSVMFDGSRLPYEENVRITKKVATIAHVSGISAEGELGRVTGLEGDLTIADENPAYTDPVLAKSFVEETGIDALAPGIGNIHGFYKAEPKLDFPRLREIRRLTGIPLVLHGATGIPSADIKKAIEMGVRKINVATLVKYAFVQGLKKHLEKNPDDFSVNVIKSGREAVRDIVREQILCLIQGFTKESQIRLEGR